MDTLHDAPATAWTWRAMGTTWRIYHRGGVDGELARDAAALVAADEERWTRFRPFGDVFHLNAGAGRPVEVAPETLALLELALAWQDETRGVFDPLVGGAVAAWGYERSLRAADPGVARSPAPRPLCGERLEVERARGRARVPAGVRLDLGGIAKSYAASRVAPLLGERCSARELLLDAGGALVAVRGEHVVGVEVPGRRELDGVGPAV